MQDTGIVLWGTPLSSYTAKVRVALHAKGLVFAEREPEGGYRSEAWRARVPTGTIPALELDGPNGRLLLSESEAINEFIDESWPEPPLMPRQPLARAQARYRSRFHDLHLEPAVRALFPYVKRVRLEGLGAAGLDARIRDLEQRLQQLGRVAGPDSLPAAPFMGGGMFTLADCGYAVTLPLMDMLCAAMQVTLAGSPPWLADYMDCIAQQPPVVSALASWRIATQRWIDSQA